MQELTGKGIKWSWISSGLLLLDLDLDVGESIGWSGDYHLSFVMVQGVWVSLRLGFWIILAWFWAEVGAENRSVSELNNGCLGRF